MDGLKRTSRPSITILAAKKFSIERPDTSEKQIIFCTMSVISMCLHIMMIQRVRKKTKDLSLPPEILNLEAFVEHVVKFSLAGIAAIRTEINADTSARKEA